MTSGSGIVRLVGGVVVATTVLAACGGGSDSETAVTGQAVLVSDSAPEVQDASVESTTPGGADSTIAPPPSTEVAVTPVAPTTTEPPATTTTTTSAPSTTEPPGSAGAGVPVGYMPISDDSGDLRANVPAAWVQTDGAPDGELRQLSAAPDLAGFLGGYTLSGMLLITGAAATPDAWMDALTATVDVAQTDGCVIDETSDYSDGVYTGTEHLLTCGDTASVTHLIGGRNEEGTLFFLLAIVRPVDDVDVRDQIVQSFFID